MLFLYPNKIISYIQLEMSDFLKNWCCILLYNVGSGMLWMPPPHSDQYLLYHYCTSQSPCIANFSRFKTFTGTKIISPQSASEIQGDTGNWFIRIGKSSTCRCGRPRKVKLYGVVSSAVWLSAQSRQPYLWILDLKLRPDAYFTETTS